jgi:hypothetical protein
MALLNLAITELGAVGGRRAALLDLETPPAERSVESLAYSFALTLRVILDTLELAAAAEGQDLAKVPAIVERVHLALAAVHIEDGDAEDNRTWF